MAGPLIKAVRERTSLPLAVGFGVSKREHFGELANQHVEGVVVGSAFMRMIEELRDDPRLEAELENFAKELKRT